MSKRIPISLTPTQTMLLFRASGPIAGDDLGAAIRIRKAIRKNEWFIFDEGSGNFVTAPTAPPEWHLQIKPKDPDRIWEWIKADLLRQPRAASLDALEVFAKKFGKTKDAEQIIAEIIEADEEDDEEDVGLEQARSEQDEE